MLIREQGEERVHVPFEDDGWFGGGAVILAGVTIGRGSVIDAGSVVTRCLPSGRVALVCLHASCDVGPTHRRPMRTGDPA